MYSLDNSYDFQDLEDWYQRLVKTLETDAEIELLLS